MQVTVRTVELQTERLNMISGELMDVYVEDDKVLGTVLSTDDDELSCYLPMKDDQSFDDLAEVGDDLTVYNFVGTVRLNGVRTHFVERLILPKFELDLEC